MLQITTVRVYACSIEGECRYLHFYVLRQHDHGRSDIPLPPWMANGSYSNMSTCITSLPNAGSTTSPVLFRTFAFGRNTTPSSNNSLAAVVPGLRWNGFIVVLRCSRVDPNHIVNMRTGDDVLAGQILLRYAFTLRVLLRTFSRSIASETPGFSKSSAQCR